MMDDKMRAAFRAWHDSVVHIGPEDIVDWTIYYLRSHQEPVAAQHRFRSPQKTAPNWSIWQPCAVANRPSWDIDSQGYEVEYRNLYTHPIPSTPIIRAVFETVDAGPYGAIGTTDAPIKRIVQEDDGVFTVVIDHWPSAAPTKENEG